MIELPSFWRRAPGMIPRTSNDEEIFRLERSGLFQPAWIFVWHRVRSAAPGYYVLRPGVCMTLFSSSPACEDGLAGRCHMCLHRGSGGAGAEMATPLTSLRARNHGWS